MPDDGACFVAGRVSAGDDDFLFAMLESSQWKSEKIRRIDWTLFETS